MLFTLLMVIALGGVVMSGLYVSVESRSADRKRQAEQSSPLTNQKNDSGSATRETAPVNAKSQPGSVALGDLAQVRANNHWKALRRFSALPASPVAAMITATKTDAIFTDLDSDGKADPGDTLQYTIVINNSGTDANNTVFTDTLTDTNLMFVPGSVETTPLARPDSYTGIVGNVLFTQNAAGGVLVNDSDPDNVGPALTVTAGNITSTNNGNVVMSADGSFTYNPPVGYEGTDTFTYTLNDNEGNTDTGTVSITVAGMVWFINNNAAACSSNCDGRLTNPFTTLVGFQAVNDGVGVSHPAAGDNIFIYESATAYTGPVTLLSDQRLIGQDATATLSTITGLNPPNSNFPAMDSGNGTIVKITSLTNAINLNSAGAGATNLIRGLTVGTTTGIGISGTGFGTLTVLDVNMDDSPNRGGQALSLNTGALSATFANIRSTNSSAAGVALTSVTGSLTSSGVTSITNPGTIGISVNTSGATLNFGNTTSTQSAGTGVSLTTNTGTITFGSLNITPDSGQKGLVATNNTNTITATSGTISTTSNTAVEITKSSTTTPLAISLTSVSANGGTNGIVMTNTSGGFTVAGSTSGMCGGAVGSGPPASAATATAPVTADCTGGTIQSTTGAGILLSNVTNVSLTRMWVKSGGDDGIGGTNVTGFSLTSSLIENNGNVIGEAGLDFGGVNDTTPDGLFGTASITNSTIRNSFEHNVSIRNQNGTLSMTVTGSQFNNISSNTSSTNGLFYDIIGTASVTVNAHDNYFEANRASHFQAAASNSASYNVTFKNNTLKGGHSTALGQGITINAATGVAFGGYTGRIDYDVDGNNFQGAKSNAIITNLGTSGAAAIFDGFIRNNIIGTTGVALSGSSAANCIEIDAHGNGNHILSVTNNTLKRCYDRGILVLANDGNGSANLTITGNTINDMLDINATDGTPREAVHVSTGATTTNVFGQIDSHAVCLNLSGNTLDSPSNFVPEDVRLRQRFRTSIRLPGYGGGAFDATAVQNFVQGNNPGGEVVSATFNDDPGVTTDGYLGGAACSTPSMSVRNNGTPKSTGAQSAIGISDRSKSETEDILRATHDEGPGGDNLRKVTQAELLAMIQAAIERWREAGISAEDLARLQAMTFEIADLPNGQLATATSTHVRVDETAAGYGWYLDSAPMEDSEFDVAVPGNELQTTEQSPAFGRMDLLTVVMRELGIAYKHGRKTVIKGLKPLMQNTLSPAVRRLPKSQNIKLPAPPVGVSDANQSSGGQSLASQESMAASQPKPEYLAHGRSARRLNHAAKNMAGASSLPAMPVAADVTTNIGVLPANKSITIKFRAQIKSPLVTPASTVCNQGTVTADGPITVTTTDPGPPIVNGPTCTPLDVADVKVTKTDSVDPVTAGNNLTYTVTVTNDGPSAATSVQLTDNLPSNATVTFVSGQQTNGPIFTCTYPSLNSSGGTVSCSIATLNSGASATFEVVLNVGAATANGTSLSNTATVSTTKTDPDPSNNTKTETTQVQTRADLKMEKAGPATGNVGDPTGFDYTLTVTNQGPSNNTGGFTVTDTLPTGVTFQTTGSSAECSAVGQVVTCTDNTGLAVNGTKVFTLHVKIDPTVVGGTNLQNSATVASNGTVDPTSGNNTATPVSTIAQANADLSIAKTGPSSAVAGAPAGYDYTITVTNNGPSNNTGGFSVTDTLPTGLTFHSVGSSSECSAVGQVVTCTDNTGLAVLANKVFTVHVTVAASVASGTVLSNTASVASNGTTDPVSLNNNTSLTPVNTTISTSADIQVTKTDSPDPVVAGTDITYTVTIINNGPSDAQGVSLTDGVPANTKFVSGAQNTGPVFNCTYPAAGASTGNVSCTIATLASGASATFEIKVKVDVDAADGSSISNTATGSSTTTDPNANNTADTETTSVQARADLSVAKTGPATATSGDTAGFDYTLTVTNNGPSNNTGGSTVTDTLPGGLTFQTTGSSSGCSAAGQIVTCTDNAGMAVGGTKQFTVHVTLGSFVLDGTVLANTASVASNGTTDPNGANNSSNTVNTTAQANADLSIAKTGPSSAVAGASFDYTLTVTNNGLSDNTGGFTVTDTLPTGVTFQSMGSSSGCSAIGQVVTCTDNTGLAALANKVFTVHVTVASSVTDGTVLSNTASVASNGTTDPSSGNNTAPTSVNTTISTSADIEVTKTDSPDPVTAGTDLTYTVTIKNNGPSDAQTVELTDATPTGTTFVSEQQNSGPAFNCTNPTVGQTGTTSCTIATLASGASAVFEIKVKVGANVANGSTIDNSAAGSTTTTDPTPGNNTGMSSTTVATSADLSLAKSGPATTKAGAAAGYDYTLTVTNNGPSNNTGGFTVTDTLATGVTFQTTGSSTGCSAVGQVVTCTDNTGLAVLGTKVFTVHVTVASSVADGTVLANAGTVASGGTTDPTSGNNTSSTVNTTVQAEADISIDKTDSSDPAGAGTDLTYTITVSNTAGPSDAQNLELSDTLPANTTLVSFTVPAGWTRTDSPLVPVGGTGTVKATAPTLAAGATAQFTLVVKIDPNTPHLTVLTNTASVTTTTSDPNTPNSEGETTTVNQRPDMSVTKTDQADPLMIGEQIKYNIKVKNNGPSNATGVVLTERMPSSATYVSATPSVGSCAAPVNNKVICQLGNMSNGAEATVDVVLQSGGNPNTIFDTATVTANETDSDLSNNEDVESTRLVGFRQFRFTPGTVTGGCETSTGKLMFTSGAPAGLVINFADNLGAINPISPVTTVGGELFVEVTAVTNMVNGEQLGTVTATAAGGNSLAARLRLLPVTVVSLGLSPNPVQGGTQVTGTVTLSCAAAQQIVVTLLTNTNKAKPDVATVTFNPGDTVKQFTITTKTVAAQTTAIITARASNGSFVRSNLTINP